MELTKKQIQKVEEYLKRKDFDFIDLKIEILDHMISDIEKLMNENYSFDNAYKKTILKWEKHFEATSSFYFGFQFSESKMVVDKATKMFKPFYFIYLAAYFLPFIILQSVVEFKPSKATSDFINGFLLSTSFIALICFIVMAINVVKTKIKTTYSFIIKTQYLGVLLLIIPLITQSFFDKKGILISIFFGMYCAGITVVFISHYFYRKHKKAIQKNSFII